MHGHPYASPGYAVPYVEPTPSTGLEDLSNRCIKSWVQQSLELLSDDINCLGYPAAKEWHPVEL
ncbi:hypothetical protein KEM48_012989 [Puccinia striiformis f. sp. tritici PST-130]|nr:hypothetical protein KEM48_012989 [Puccinia striiformis f. sp. tritici PST-130]